MHVLVLTPAFPHPGNPAEGLFHEQHALALRRKGLWVTVLVCKPWLPWIARVGRRHASRAPLPREENRDGVRVLYARYLHLPRHRAPCLTVGSCRHSIRRTLQEHGLGRACNLIQVHGGWPVGLAAEGIAASMGCPLVITLHIQEDSGLLAARRAGPLYRSMLEKAAAVVGVGSPMERFIFRMLPDFSPEKFQIIPNGVDHEAVAEVLARGGHPNGAGRIVSVGNLWPTKGIDLNLRALARLKNAGVPWSGYAIVGEGPEREPLERLARDLGIADRVQFRGTLPHGETLLEIAGADVFSLPSWQEAFGVVYLEAMACGKPVIGCRGQGAEDIFGHEQEGLLVGPRDEGDLAAALGRLLENRPLARKMGQAGSARAREFSWERNAENYLQLYRKVCSADLATVFPRKPWGGISKKEENGS